MKQFPVIYRHILKSVLLVRSFRAMKPLPSVRIFSNPLRIQAVALQCFDSVYAHLGPCKQLTTELEHRAQNISKPKRMGAVQCGMVQSGMELRFHSIEIEWHRLSRKSFDIILLLIY